MIKTYDYIIVLKKPDYKVINWVSKLMLLLSVFAFTLVAFMSLSQTNIVVDVSRSWLLLFFCSLIIGWWIFSFGQAKRGLIPYYRFALMFAAWGWFVVPGGKLVAIIYLIACFLEKPVKVPPEVAFDAVEIVFNSFPKKILLWPTVNNVVLKDGLLTIDLKNNTLIQKQVNDEVSPAIELEFNGFCKEQLDGKTVST
ncbi:MAG: hypothetical protein H7101_05460 [Deinococcales bacterium]|nr:hypothetical protein [Chitinophagaceae bacterium]